MAEADPLAEDALLPNDSGGTSSGLPVLLLAENLVRLGKEEDCTRRAVAPVHQRLAACREYCCRVVAVLALLSFLIALLLEYPVAALSRLNPQSKPVRTIVTRAAPIDKPLYLVRYSLWPVLACSQ